MTVLRKITQAHHMKPFMLLYHSVSSQYSCGRRPCKRLGPSCLVFAPDLTSLLARLVFRIVLHRESAMLGINPLFSLSSIFGRNVRHDLDVGQTGRLLSHVKDSIHHPRLDKASLDDFLVLVNVVPLLRVILPATQLFCVLRYHHKQLAIVKGTWLCGELGLNVPFHGF
ncbi:hypothetical protein BDR22DRAFT_91967 [Usnea florida]